MAQTVQNPTNAQETPTGSTSPRNTIPSRKQLSVSKLIPVIFVLLVLGILAVLGVLGRSRKTETPKNQSSSAVAEVSNPPNPVLAEYVNDDYNFKFKYNDVWELTEASASGVLGSKASFGFTFKNTLPEASAESKPNLSKLVVHVFDKSTEGDFLSELTKKSDVKVEKCSGSANCKLVRGNFPIQAGIPGIKFNYGFELIDENGQSANIDFIPQPLGAVIRNFSAF